MGNKYSVPKRETHKSTDASSTIPLDSPLGIILKHWAKFNLLLEF
jgi:hypothetical protein